MKTIITILLVCSCSLCRAQSNYTGNNLFGAGSISITSNSKILPSITIDRDYEANELSATNFTSGKIYFVYEEAQSPVIIRVNNGRALKRELKKCKPGTMLVLVDCVVKTDDDKKGEPFNQMITLK